MLYTSHSLPPPSFPVVKQAVKILYLSEPFSSHITSLAQSLLEPDSACWHKLHPWHRMSSLASPAQPACPHCMLDQTKKYPTGCEPRNRSYKAGGVENMADREYLLCVHATRCIVKTTRQSQELGGAHQRLAAPTPRTRRVRCKDNRVLFRSIVQLQSISPS